MIDHVTIRLPDRAEGERFYDTVLAALGLVRGQTHELYTEWGDFSIASVSDEHPVTRRLHVGFAASSHEEVDAFHRAGVEAGFRSDGEPGPRPEYVEDYYGAFLLDPGGNSAEAVHHAHSRGGGAIDHLWLRVADLAGAKRFYDEVAPFAGMRGRRRKWGEQFVGERGSFMLVQSDAPSQNVHLAFTAPANATVDAFHAAATAAGYEDNGAPGERAVYHPGYYGAFVFDPDGNNIEVVCHNR